MSPHVEPPFAVVIPMLNSRRTLESCLDSVLHALDRVGGGQVVVVDNGSADGSPELIAERYGARITIALAPGLRVGAARNVGVALVGAPLISFVDSDCVLEPEYYVRALQVMADPDIAATGSMYALPNDPRWLEEVWYRLHRTPADGPVTYLNAGSFVVRRSVFQAVGGFDQGLESGEDAELGQRMNDHGYRIESRAALVARHLGNPKSIRGFVQKQTWHAMGMFGTVSLRSVDRPTLMLFAHLLAIVAPVALALGGWLSWSSAVGASALASFAVPAATVLFRVRRGGSAPRPAAGVFLYWLYYLARARALGRLAARALFRPRPGRGRVAGPHLVV